jgi:zinc transport system permease protein
LALLTGTAPIPLAVVSCIVGAVVVEILRPRGKASGDVGLAVLFYGGLAAGVFLSGISGVGAGGLAQYLFGSLTTVTPDDLILIGLLAIVILVITLGLAPQLYAVSTDEEFARTQGLRVRLYHIAVVSLAAVTVALAMRTVGLLLVSALMVVPVAAARNLVRGFTSGLGCAIAIGVATAVGGAAASFCVNARPGVHRLVGHCRFCAELAALYLIRQRAPRFVLPNWSMMMRARRRAHGHRATHIAMPRARGIRQCSMAITLISSTKVIGMLPMLIITMNTEPPGRRRQGAAI